ncbi:MAG: PD-(D/E)XK nuclease family protein [Nitrospirae bacterium]|nr:PD-(D/E)XK nuclease family protein [Nitrospirota bacterium]
MKKGTIFITPLDHRNKRNALFREIISICPEGDYSRLMYIAPTASALEEVRKQFFKFQQARSKSVRVGTTVATTLDSENIYIPFRTMTIQYLCHNLQELYGEEETISNALRPLILSEILDDRDLSYSRLLSELMGNIRHYLPGTELYMIKRAVGEQIFEEKTLLRAVRAIEDLETYEQELVKRSLLDEDGLLLTGIPLAKEHLEIEILVLDGFFDPTPLEKEILSCLMDKAEEVYAVALEKSEFAEFLINGKKTHGRPFIVRAQSAELRLVPSTISGQALSEVEGTQNYVFYSYPSMEDEVEGIARTVKGLIIEGVRPQEIIISFPSLAKYLPMVRRIFQKHRIPACISRYNLSSSKPLVAIEGLIACVEGNYSRDDFLSVITSRYFPNIPDVLKEWAIFYSNRAGVIKGKDAWLSLRATVINSSEDELTEEEINRLNDIQKEIRNVIRLLEKLREEKTFASFLDAIEAVLNRLGFFDSIDDALEEAFHRELSALKRFAGLFASDSDSSGFEKFISYLKHRMIGIMTGDEDNGRVRIVPLEEAVELEAGALFFGGMCEGEFPSRPAIDPILPEKVKKALGLPYLDRYLERQKKYFERLLHVSRREPYFSYPSQEADKLFLPSPFLDWTKVLTPSVPNIPTEEEILIAQGTLQKKDFSATFWGENIYSGGLINGILQKRFGRAAFIKVTDIEAYRQCPLRFYIEKVLGLEEDRPPRFEIEAKLWGKLSHKALEYLYRDGDVEPELLKDRLMAGLNNALKDFPVNEFWAKVAREIFKMLFPHLLEQEIALRNEGYTPYKVEAKLKGEVDGLRLKGKIDRIDIKRSLPRHFGVTELREEKVEVMVLIDYKTGSAQSSIDSLQLPLYAALWQSNPPIPPLIKEGKGGFVEKVGFYSLKDGHIDWYPRKITIEDFIEEALTEAKSLVDGMREGRFGPETAKDDSCYYCHHRPLCGRTYGKLS